MEIAHRAPTGRNPRTPAGPKEQAQEPIPHLAVLRDPARIARYLASIGEPTELPKRSPSRGPPYWKSRVLRRMATGHDEVA